MEKEDEKFLGKNRKLQPLKKVEGIAGKDAGGRNLKPKKPLIIPAELYSKPKGKKYLSLRESKKPLEATPQSVKKGRERPAKQKTKNKMGQEQQQIKSKMMQKQPENKMAKTSGSEIAKTSEGKMAKPKISESKVVLPFPSSLSWLSSSEDNSTGSPEKAMALEELPDEDDNEVSI